MTQISKDRLPLRALITFEAATRHRNFTHAAVELSVTQAAVSKQIKQLEEYLGAQLFVRQGRIMSLTEPAKMLEDAVKVGLSRIEQVISDIRNLQPISQLTVTATIATATLWLMPHLANFRNIYPDIGIKLVVSDLLSNLAVEKIDIGIRYGDGAWPLVKSQFLFDVSFFPACSPNYLQNSQIYSPEDLISAKLLDLVGPVAHGADWISWFESHDVTVPQLKAALRFNNYPLLVQAAVDGQGVILAWRGVTDFLFESGALVRIFKGELASTRSYYLVTQRSVPLSSEAQIFYDWLLSETEYLRL